MSDFKIEIFYELNSEIKKIWLNLESQASITVFQTYDWISVWDKYSRLNNYRNIIIITVKDLNNRCLAIFPLCKKNFFCYKQIEFIGDNFAEYKQPLIDRSLTNYEVKKIWNTIKEQISDYDIFIVERYPLRIEDRIHNFDLKKIGFKYLSFENSVSTKRFDNKDNFINQVSKRTLKDNKRYKRNLMKVGKFEFKVISNKEEYSYVLNQIAKSMSKKLEGLGIFNKKSVHENLKFYKLCNLLNSDKNADKLLVGLFIDNELISASWSLIYNYSLYYIFPAVIKDSLRKYSPGRVLLQELIDYAFKNKITLIDFTLGDEKYKFKWGGLLNKLESYAFINSYKGVIIFCIIYLKCKLKKVEKLRNIYRRINIFLNFRK